ncbi:MAG: YdbL family protein [Pseudomonadota bacterium]
MKKFLLMFSMFLAVSFSSGAFAIDLDEAKAQGLVGERIDGYVSAVVANPTAEVQQLVTTTNDGRRKVYADLAAKNNITVDAVALVSGEKLRASAGKGQFVQNAAGAWEQK